MRAESPACRLAQGSALGIIPTSLRPEWATETFHINIIGSRAGSEGERRRSAHTFAMDNCSLMQGKMEGIAPKKRPFSLSTKVRVFLKPTRL